MIGDRITDTLPNAAISGVSFKGLSVTTRDGRPARLAILDEDGNVIHEGAAVALECWNVSIQCLRNYWKGEGYLVVHTSPTGLVTSGPLKRGR